MPVITNSGIQSISLNEYREAFNDAYQEALGSDLSVEADSPQGQLIGIDALNASQIDDVIVQLFNALNIFSASGNQLDAFGILFGIPRLNATRSTVVATLTGVEGTIIPAGSQAKTTNNDIFVASDNITIPVGNSTSGNFIANEAGEIAIDANTLTQIVTPITGWETIDNSANGIPGTNEESDNVYRTRIFNTLAKNAAGIVASVEANVLALDGVESVNVKENDKNVNVIVQNVELLPHSIAVIVEVDSIDPATNQEIAEAILNKSLGCGTEGANTGIQTEVIVPDRALPVYFYPVVGVPVQINVDITLLENPPSDPESAIKDALTSYFLDDVQVAQEVYDSQLICVISDLGGIAVTSLLTNKVGDPPTNPTVPDLNERLTVDANDITVAIN